MLKNLQKNENAFLKVKCPKCGQEIEIKGLRKKRLEQIERWIENEGEVHPLKAIRYICYTYGVLKTTAERYLQDLTFIGRLKQNRNGNIVTIQRKIASFTR